MDRSGGGHALSLCEPAENSSRAFVEAMHPLSLFRLVGLDSDLDPRDTLTILNKRRTKMALKVKQDGNILKIELPLEKPIRSKSGKTTLVASTHGVITTPVRYKGRNIALVANAFVYPKRKVSDSE